MKKVSKLKKLASFSLKFDLKMKLSLFLLIFSLFQLQANETYGQKTKISLSINNMSLENVFDEIESRTEFKFIYKDSEVDYQKIVSIKAKKKQLSVILNKLFVNSNIAYKILDKQIIITKKVVENTTIEKEQEASKEAFVQFKVSGLITDAAGEPLPGASIVVKGTSTGTSTDFDGKYSLNLADDNAVLVVSFIGFVTQEVAVQGKNQINIQLVEDAANLDEVVVVGYGTQKARNVTGAVSSIKASALENQAVPSFEQAIAGKIAGVQITEASGAPGTGGRIRIRGTSSISAGNDPLYVVDGVPINNDQQGAGGSIPRPDGGFTYNSNGLSVNVLSSINSNDIKSVEVLKDAAAAAIYGSRGSNGVVLISTKNGYRGDPKINYNVYSGFSQVAKKADLLNAYEFAELARDGHNNTYLDNVPTGSINDSNATRLANGSPKGGLIPEFAMPYLNGEQGLTDTDWQDEIFRTAMVQSHSLSVMGGNEKTTYYGSLNYLKQEGVVINTDFTQYSARLNLKTKVSDKLQVGFNMSPSQEKSNRITNGPWWSEGIIGLALAISPNFPVYNSDGSYNWGRNSAAISNSGDTQFLNPVALANEIKNEVNHFRFLGNAYVDYDIIEDLRYRLSVGIDLNRFTTEYYRPSILEDISFIGTPGQPSIPDAYQNEDQFQNWVIEHTLNYKKEIGLHNFDAIVGFSAQKEEQKSLYSYATNFPNDLVTSIDGGQVVDSGGRTEEWSLMSYLARVQYSYDGKYLLSAAVRTDGSSRFGENNRWGTFPSISAGWRVSNEDFFKSNFISDLKLRGSFGVTGNFQIPNYGTTSLLTESNYVGDDENIVNGLSPETAPNPNLKWERTSTIDFGLDLGLFDNQVSLNFDYYKSKTKDLLLNVPVPTVSGFNSSLTNIGEVQNTGFEVGVSTNFEIGKVKINASMNISTNQNEVLALGPDNNDIIASVGGGAGFSFLTRVGEEVGSYYALDAIGVLSQEDIDNGIAVYPGSKAGDLKIRDIKEDGVINNEDRTILGSVFPDYTAGLNATISYEDFDFGFNLQSVQGFETNALINRYNYNVEGNMNNLTRVLDRYQSESNPGNGIVPRANRATTGALTQPSSWHVEDGSFVRIRNLTFGYTLPKVALNTYFEKVRIYVAAQNPFTFTDYPYYNPEVSSTPDAALTPGQDYGNYPLSKTFTLGLNITF